jgi:uncharacterized protein YggE
MKKIIFSLLLLAGFTSISLAQGYDPRRTISVSGDAEVKVAPDEVVISLAVETNNMDIDKAREENDQKVSAVLAMAKKMGIEDKYMQTDYLSVEPRYDYYNNSSERQRKFLGYYMTKNITLTLKDITKFEKFVAEALKLGTNYIRGMDFQTTELRKHRDAARLMAIRAAKEKATALANELGQKVGKPITISEGTPAIPVFKAARNAMALNAVASDDSSAEGSSSVAAGQIEIKANVSVTFELE